MSIRKNSRRGMIAVASCLVGLIVVGTAAAFVARGHGRVIHIGPQVPANAQPGFPILARKANAITLGGGVAQLSADTPSYSGGYVYTHSRIKDTYNVLGIPMALQSCLQANDGTHGWYSVKCAYDGKSNAAEKNITQSVQVPACGWWFRTWSWGQAWWLYVTWHTDSGALTSNANYLC